MRFSQLDIQKYLANVRSAIDDGRCQIARNSRRQENIRLFNKYLLTEEGAYDIIRKLTPMNFCEAVQNEHPGFENETLYVFREDVKLIERTGGPDEIPVSLYIKLNYLETHYVVVISFHVPKWPLTYYFDSILEDTIEQ